MKLSKYNYYHYSEQVSLIYNVLTKSYIVLTQDAMNLLQSSMDNVCVLKKKHIELYEALLDRGMIVAQDVDETNICIETLRNRYQNKGVLSITVNPTLNCNVKCWYCYETHTESKMSIETIQSIQELIINKVNTENILEIHLGFFGGEPLLYFEDCVLPLIDFAYNYSNTRNIEFSIGFTTNGILMDKDVVDKLISFRIPIHIQVPFDGNQDYHNKVKKSNINSYQTTLFNVKYAISRGIYTVIRCNYTNQSVDSFSELIRDLSDEIKLYPDKLNFSFQKIWQVKETNDTVLAVERLQHQVQSHSGKYYDAALDTSSCYADYNNSIVVNYNGDIYQCTARDFTDENKEGVLSKTGIITYNERYHHRMKSLYANETCKQCIVWPICTACSQKRLENHNNQCVLNLSEGERVSKIKSIVQTIIENHSV